jgi:hypothetical protein
VYAPDCREAVGACQAKTPSRGGATSPACTAVIVSCWHRPRRCASREIPSSYGIPPCVAHGALGAYPRPRRGVGRMADEPGGHGVRLPRGSGRSGSGDEGMAWSSCGSCRGDGCPYYVREPFPTFPDSLQQGNASRLIIHGLGWGWLGAVAHARGLITQRSLVQIQPPLPTNSKGYGTFCNPFFVAGVHIGV